MVTIPFPGLSLCASFLVTIKSGVIGYVAMELKAPEEEGGGGVAAMQ
jgi:hypothetical protein